MLPPPVSKTTSPRKENVVAGTLGNPADGASSRTVKVKVPWKFPRERVPRVQSPNGLGQPAVNRTESKLAKYRLHCGVASASWPALVAMTAPNPINQAVILMCTLPERLRLTPQRETSLGSASNLRLSQWRTTLRSR